MSNPNRDRPGGKPGQRSRKPDQPPSAKPDQQQSRKTEQLQNQRPEQLQSRKPEPQLSGSKQLDIDAAVASASTPSIDFQTIATAYGDYSKKSFEQTKAFVEKLSGVRSLDKAIEIQTEFAKQAYETFVTESQKIRELYSGLARQGFSPFERLAGRTTLAAAPILEGISPKQA